MGEDGEQEKGRRVELEMVCKMKSTFIFKIKLEKNPKISSLYMHQQSHWGRDHGYIPTFKSINDNTLPWNKLKKRVKGP